MVFIIWVMEGFVPDENIGSCMGILTKKANKSFFRVVLPHNSVMKDIPKEVINRLARQIERLRPRKMASQGFSKLELSVRKLVMDSVSISKGQKKRNGLQSPEQTITFLLDIKTNSLHTVFMSKEPIMA